MMEFIITNHNQDQEIAKAGEAIGEILDAGNDCKVTVSRVSNGTLSLDRHWRALMVHVSKIMRSYGVVMRFQSRKGLGNFERPFTPQDAHELFTSQLMPIGTNGKRKSWSKSGRDNMEVATTGDRCQALERLYQYWMEKGHNLERYADSEYEKLRQSQEV